MYSGTSEVLCIKWGITFVSGVEMKLSAFRKSLSDQLSGVFPRVINAGKSTHNEDQASCEVLTVKKKAGAAASTPNRNSTKRRASLPNGEGLQLKESAVRPSRIPVPGRFPGERAGTLRPAHSGPAARCSS